MVKQWGVPQVEALQLQKSIASLMREVGPELQDLHWKQTTRLGRESSVLSEEALRIRYYHPLASISHGFSAQLPGTIQ